MAAIGGLHDCSPRVVSEVMAEAMEAERAASRRMILAASKQATDDGIRWLELVEKYGVNVLPHALKEMRAKSAALGEP